MLPGCCVGEYFKNDKEQIIKRKYRRIFTAIMFKKKGVDHINTTHTDCLA